MRINLKLIKWWVKWNMFVHIGIANSDTVNIMGIL